MEETIRASMGTARRIVRNCSRDDLRFGDFPVPVQPNRKASFPYRERYLFSRIP